MNKCNVVVQVVGESAVRHIGEIGSRVLHTFHVVNEGPWPADSVTVHIDWPYQVCAVFHTEPCCTELWCRRRRGRGRASGCYT